MSKEIEISKIAIFDDKEIRKGVIADEWVFSVIDVVAVLTDSENPRNYWNMLKKRESEHGIQLSTFCVQLKLISKDGKKYLTDAANTESLFRIIQSIPSRKAEPFKLWLARVGSERIDEIEKTVKHDVIAFLTNVAEYVGEEARHIHYGMTSSDILDTSLSLQMKDAGEILLKKLNELKAVLKNRAIEFKYTVCVGRSHGIHAEPTTMGLKFALWFEECKRNIVRLEKAIETISVGKISGAVGTFEHLSPEVEKYVCEKLGLKPAPISTQIIQRDRHAEFLSTLAIIGTSLEKIALEAELLELKANPERLGRGTIIESQLDKGRGVTATVLVQKGTLKIGDPFIAGVTHGRVRAMFDERGKKVFVAGPSTPVLVLGFEAAPQAGDVFAIVESEREARETSIKRMQLKREQDHRQVHHITLDEIASQISQGGFKELPIIVKGDVDGSIEALSDSLMKLSNAEVSVNVIHKGVGAISEGDVLLATASKAIIIGFHVRPNVNARKLAEAEKVDIRLYNIIYDAIAEVKSALEGMLSPVVSEENVATIEVRDIFKVPKVGTIAGCYVTDGKVDRKHKLRLFRDGIAIYEGDFSSLKRFKDDVKEVERGFECGIGINNFNDIKVGDVIETYKLIETKKKLD